jgi:hypothetical protein
VSVSNDSIAVPVCSSSGHGTLAHLSGSTPSSWTQYTYSYTVATMTPILMFGFQTEPIRIYYLDDVSVVDVSTPTIELLDNPSFENSSTTLTGWTLWCAASCGTSSTGQVTSGSDCYSSSGNCFEGRCYSSGIIFLGQSFPATIGHTYTISYRLIGVWGLIAADEFYVDVI